MKCYWFIIALLLYSKNTCQGVQFSGSKGIQRKWSIFSKKASDDHLPDAQQSFDRPSLQVVQQTFVIVIVIIIIIFDKNERKKGNK